MLYRYDTEQTKNMEISIRILTEIQLNSIFPKFVSILPANDENENESIILEIGRIDEVFAHLSTAPRLKTRAMEFDTDILCSFICLILANTQYRTVRTHHVLSS